MSRLKTIILSQVFIAIKMLIINEVGDIKDDYKLIKKCEKLLKTKKLFKFQKLFKSQKLTK